MCLATVRKGLGDAAESMILFVGNLSFQATDEQVGTVFSAFGTVAGARVIRDRETARARGFALVDMPDIGEAMQAMRGITGQPMVERVVRVCEARPREDGPRI